MNKLVNTYLDAVDSLLAIHQKHPRPDDFYRILCDLSSAMCALNEEPDPKVFRHDWTPEELAQREKLLKPLTLRYLKLQVDAAMAACECGAQQFDQRGPDWGTGVLWIIGDFEIRRRK